MGTARSRFISFRVTDSELNELKLACDLLGAKSLSALARKATLNLSRAGGESIDERVYSLNRQISSLEVALTRLSDTLEKNSVCAAEKQE